MTDPWARPPQYSAPGQATPPPGQYSAPGQAPQATTPPQDYPSGEAPKSSRIKNMFRDPLSIVLVVVIVLALGAAGLLGGELYARHRADQVVAGVVSCVVQDQASASFDPLPPFLLQHLTGHYTNINIETAGNQIRNAKGMKVVIDIKDVRLEDSGNSSGSVGALSANISWSADGIKQTIQDAIPLVGAFVSNVTTNPNAGTIELEGALGSITAKPQVVDGGISLQVTNLTGLGFTLPREAVQPALDAFTSGLTKNYPMGITADSVQVTDSGVQSHFAAQNAEIPKGEQDACFQGL
jgi:hypothetical protein